MTRAVFETATIADALRKAEICAPRGAAGDHAFDVAAGVMLELTPNGAGGGTCRVRATSLDVFYDEIIDVLELDAPAQWRIPGSKFIGVVQALPSGPGKQAAFVDDGHWLTLTSGRTKAKVMTLPTMGFPSWERTGVTTTPVVDLGQRILSVSWACDPKMEPFTGIYFDGAVAMAANQQRAAVVPCPASLPGGKPITVPAKILGPILRNAGDIGIAVTDRFLVLHPDQYTEIKCALYDKNIPSPRGFIGRTYDTAVRVDRKMLSETIKRMLNITKGVDEVPVVQVLLSGQAASLRLAGEYLGESIEEVIDVEGAGPHPPVMLQFVPSTFTDAVGRAPDVKVTLSYNVGGAKNDVVRLDGGDGYICWFVQWKGTKEE